jgi:hypothetical protein
MYRWATQQGGYWDTQKWLAADFNGDGRTDIAKTFNHNGLMSIDVHLSTGFGFSMYRWATRQGGYWDTQKWLAGDFNGDRRTDIAKIFGEQGIIANSLTTEGGLLANAFVFAEFSPETFNQPVNVTHRASFESTFDIPAELVSASRYYEISAIYTDTLEIAQLNKPYTLTIQYDDADVADTNENLIALYFWNGVQWIREPSFVDITNNLVSAHPTTLGLWGLFSERSIDIFLPLVANDR